MNVQTKMFMPKFFERIYHQLGERCWPQLTHAFAFADLQPLAITCMTVTVTLLGVRHLGWLQPLELNAFDLMVQLRPDPGPDPRLLIVEITDQDIKAFKKWPLSDRVLAKALAEIARLEPTAIGLDIIRDIPYEPGNAELATQLKNPKVFPITFIGNSPSDRVKQPPNIPDKRVGFNDVVLDPDGRVRRNLMFASDGKTTLPSFSMRLAFAYLDSKKIDSKLTQVSAERVDPKGVKAKMVLKGVPAITVNDLFSTPYSANAAGNRLMPGVLIHATATSQILSAVLDGKKLFWYWEEWQEILWIAVWSAVGGCLAWRVEKSLNLIGLAIAAGGSLFGFTFFLFLQQGWIPLIAPALALLITAGVAVIYRSEEHT